MNALTRYWFEFEKSPKPTALNLGCGVTAHDYDDAMQMIKEFFRPGRPIPMVTRFVQDVDLSSLDQKHVLPNIGSVVTRGVWFPRA
jgi:hypothetical protein